MDERGAVLRMGFERIARRFPRPTSLASLLYLDENHHASSPSLLRIAVLCFFWYSSSALTNNTSKQIMGLYSIPVTLTWVQFGFVALYCFLFSKYTLPPTKRIRPLDLSMARQTAVISLFQITSHVFSSVALTRVTVSFAHTIKALSPLFTVLFYRFIYQIAYSSQVYVSLIPLTLGVMLVCAARLQFDYVGFLCALAATVIFVVQNIVSKKILVANQPVLGPSLPSVSRMTGPITTNTSKLNKMNMLFYCGTLSFVFMIPIWLYYEGAELLVKPGSPNFVPLHPGRGMNSSRFMFVVQVVFLMAVNGVTHFSQNLFAFSLLAMVSPVHYSVASLCKRIAVISASIVWFNDYVDTYQIFGLLLTFFGLYLYQKARKSVDKGEARWEANIEHPESANSFKQSKSGSSVNFLYTPIKEPSSPPVLASVEGSVLPRISSLSTNLYSNHLESISKKSHYRKASIHRVS